MFPFKCISADHQARTIPGRALGPGAYYMDVLRFARVAVFC